jgi:hypothetical protein
MNNSLNSNTNGNANISKWKGMLKSKGFVTTLCSILVVVVLIVGYNLRIRNATQPVKVPVATRRLTARHLITEEDIKYVDIPSGALTGDYYARVEYVVGQYVNYDTTIQEGSLFYRGSIVSKKELPDEALLNLPEGEKLYYLTVNMLTSFANSILPGRYIDIYISTKEDNKALVGKFLENVKILQVKTADGLNVFDDSESSRIPYVIIFSLPEEQHLLMRDINAINNYSIAAGDSNFSRIEVIPIPTTAYYKDGDQEIQSTVSSQYLKDYILNLSAVIPEDIEVPTESDTQ